MSTSGYKRGHRSWGNGRAFGVIRNDGRGSASLGNPERVSIVLVRGPREAYAAILVPCVQCLEAVCLIVLEDPCVRQGFRAITNWERGHVFKCWGHGVSRHEGSAVESHGS